MKSIRCSQPNKLEMVQANKPMRRSGEVLIQIKAIGVCGTDYHAYRGKQPFFTYPRVLGHEIAAEIVEIDPNPSDMKPGDSVTIIPYLHCGTCIACRNGKSNACANLQVIGVHKDGGMSEFLAVPLDKIVKTANMTLQQTVIIEPMAIGAHAIRRANLKQNEFVLVIGAGPIGMAVMKFAKLAGAKVIAMDFNQERLDFSKRWANIDYVINATTDAMEDLIRWTDGDMVPTVIDATGSAKSMENSFKYASHGGRVVLVSLIQGEISIHYPEFHRKELSLHGSRAATKEDFEYVITCMENEWIDAESFISHRAHFDDAIDAFQHWLNPESCVIKAIIEL
ncbi:alcohol dehydrogenase [Paenibacillus marchantiophytorum]|uniref:Alcohol dehydrogenase n=1 Tax=Paenibacillus marchantiophytorum TaxID=1619310 RepID=A0ABQ2BR50_9BACL|nr:zinc-binding alcohol dehydrogenase family protein [Paenibacillus marchantiophytorum]GGI45656.1 alcohol dehydrogenase [Paenibacillus marchantiophytorum]